MQFFTHIFVTSFKKDIFITSKYYIAFRT